MSAPRFTASVPAIADSTEPQGSKGRDDLEYWNNFVKHFFSQKGVLKHSFLVRDGDEQGYQKHYEIAYPAIARYFHTHFDSGVKSMQLVMDKGTTDRTLPNDCHMVMNDKTSLVYWFEGGAHVGRDSQTDGDEALTLWNSLSRAAISVSSSILSRSSISSSLRPQATRSTSRGGW
jgi:hypothetical protein